MPGVLPPTPTVTREQQLKALRGQEEYLVDALAGIKKRIVELETQAADQSSG
jgi:hypothetical protein